MEYFITFLSKAVPAAIIFWLIIRFLKGSSNKSNSSKPRYSATSENNDETDLIESGSKKVVEDWIDSREKEGGTITEYEEK